MIRQPFRRTALPLYHPHAAHIHTQSPPEPRLTPARYPSRQLRRSGSAVGRSRSQPGFLDLFALPERVTWPAIVNHDDSGPKILTYGALHRVIQGPPSSSTTPSPPNTISPLPATRTFDTVLNILKFLGRGQICVPYRPPASQEEGNWFEEDSLSLGTVSPLTQRQERDGLPGGMMLYTSGTTAKPKGVLLTQSALLAQCASITKAWNYHSCRSFLHVLPLFHIHGLVNMILAPLYAGACVELLEPKNETMADAIWRRLLKPFHPPYPEAPFLTYIGTLPHQSKITVFSAVPTIYKNLISAYDKPAATSVLPSDLDFRAQLVGRATTPKPEMLYISGSAPLPAATKAEWWEITKLHLCERYGMTETGMILSNGLKSRNKIDGCVGWPMPSVQVRLVADNGEGAIIDETRLEKRGERGVGCKTQTEQGEIQVRGPGIFEGYHNRPEDPKDWAVDGEGRRWFRTGDIAVRVLSHWRIRGNVVSFDEKESEKAERAASSTAADDDASPSAAGGKELEAADSWINGSPYRILGRASADIIKSGGEKISAIEVEAAIMQRIKGIAEVAVVGVPNEKWGEIVAAVFVPTEEQLAKAMPIKATGDFSALDMIEAIGGGKGRLYNLMRGLPREMKPILWKGVQKIERTEMGKIDKRKLARKLWPDRFKQQGIENGGP